MATNPMDLPSAELEQVSATEVLYRGRRWTYFGGSDYFRLSWNRLVRRSISQALQRWGPNVAAGRTTTGNHPIYGELELALARSMGFPAAVLTSTGYLAPLVAVQGLAAQVTHVLMAETTHGCLQDAARLLGVPCLGFSGTDLTSLDRVLKQLGCGAYPLLISHGLSPLEGTVPPLGEFLSRLPSQAWMIVDDAHGIGTLGKRGRGVLEVLGLKDPRIVLTGTLSKALGCYGGFVLGSRELKEQIFNHSTIFQGSTAPPPPWVAGALTSLSCLEKHGPVWRQALARRIHLLRSVLKEPLRRAAPGPAFTVLPATAREVMKLERQLMSAGIYPSRIRYAQGPSAHFYRFAPSTAHSLKEITALAEIVAEFTTR